MDGSLAYPTESCWNLLESCSAAYFLFYQFPESFNFFRIRGKSFTISEIPESNSTILELFISLLFFDELNFLLLSADRDLSTLDYPFSLILLYFAFDWLISIIFASGEPPFIID